MIMIMTTVIMALIIMTIVLTSQKPDPAQLREPRASLPVMGIQIVCGNCAGDEFRPRRTYLDRFGNCSHCGGHSYLLASNIYGYNQPRPELQGLPAMDRVVANARVLAFNSTRVNKIAV
jgi:hypothetical protein